MKQKLICCNYKEAEIINLVSQLFFESLYSGGSPSPFLSNHLSIHWHCDAAGIGADWKTEHDPSDRLSLLCL